MSRSKAVCVLLLVQAILLGAPAVAQDSIAGRRYPLHWHRGASVSAALVPRTNSFLQGNNTRGQAVDGAFAGSIKAGFSYDAASARGQRFGALYQGLGIQFLGFHPGGLLGTPVSVFAYQGAPLAHFGRRLWLGYEWRFGAACGWKHPHNASPDDHNLNIAVGTAVTAHMQVGLTLNYRLSQRWTATAALEATHFSNGNTQWPNSGVNTLGMSLGVSYSFSTTDKPLPVQTLDTPEKWIYDIMAYGAWRRRAVDVDFTPVLCPGKFGVAGIQFQALHRAGDWFAFGPGAIVQYDESAGLAPYWLHGTWGENIRFYRPPFGKQLSAGVAAHAELTTPIFAINAGLGCDLLCPQGNPRFFQMLSLKTFVTDFIFLNVGYRLGNFKAPQNLMLGVGVRL